MKGVFITFEGITGTGKTTQAKLLSEALEKEGYDTLLVPEFSSSLIGKSIIESLSRDPFLRLPPVAETLLVSADRAFFTERIIVPALKEGKIIIKDRYIDSTYVYQPIRFKEDGYNINKEPIFTWLDNFNNFFKIPPHLTFLLTGDPATALKKQALIKGWDIRERDIKMAEESAKIYEELVYRSGTRFEKIYTHKDSVEESHRKIFNIAKECIENPQEITLPEIWKHVLHQKTLDEYVE